MRDQKILDLEEQLKRLDGVRSVRIVGDEAPAEIHIIATPGRSPKQVVRDVQSLAAAGFEMQIDHRIVSVVQLGDEADIPAEASNNGVARPVLERVVLATKGNAGWVEVGVRWPDGKETEGSGPTGPTRDARARAAVTALVVALEPVLEPVGARIDVDHVMIHRVGVSDSVMVRATFNQGREGTPVVGSAIIHDDVASAAVRALLHAINRKLR